MDLKRGSHAIRIINRGPQSTICILEGFEVYGDK
jgi:hypothetical protein